MEYNVSVISLGNKITGKVNITIVHCLPLLRAVLSMID